MTPAEVSMPTDTSVLVKRSFDAPVQLVWRCYVEPELFARWCLGPPGWSMPICEMDVRTGGRYRWQWRDDAEGNEFGFIGEFREVILESRLVHTQIYDPGDMGNSMGEKQSVDRIELAQESATFCNTKFPTACPRSRLRAPRLVRFPDRLLCA